MTTSCANLQTINVPQLNLRKSYTQMNLKKHFLISTFKAKQFSMTKMLPYLNYRKSRATAHILKELSNALSSPFCSLFYKSFSMKMCPRYLTHGTVSCYQLQAYILAEFSGRIIWEKKTTQKTIVFKYLYVISKHTVCYHIFSQVHARWLNC